MTPADEEVCFHPCWLIVGRQLSSEDVAKRWLWWVSDCPFGSTRLLPVGSVLSAVWESWPWKRGTVSPCPPRAWRTRPTLTAPTCCWTYGSATSTTCVTSSVVGGEKMKLDHHLIQGEYFNPEFLFFPTAHSFPIAMLSRTMNPYTKEALEYVSFNINNTKHPQHVLYDIRLRFLTETPCRKTQQERSSSCTMRMKEQPARPPPPCVSEALRICSCCLEVTLLRHSLVWDLGASTVAGLNPVVPPFLRLPGLKVIAQKFPEGMTTGSIPTSCLSSPTSSKKSSVQQQHAAEKRWRFTSDELNKIQEQLEEILIPSNSNSKTSHTSPILFLS